uniref:RING-type E3 ubiquitin transferase n=1 Tax=Leersia perrieri TaxID=77586 RepID=A0A0D9VJ79_9ORYZ
MEILGRGGGVHRRWDTSGSGSQYSFRTSVSSVAEISSEVEEASPLAPAVDDKVFVAVPADVKYGKSTLQWALQNLTKDGGKVVITHVHCPAQMIPMMGAKVHYTKMNPKQVDDYRNKEREKVEEKLDEYLLMCRKLKVSCEKLIIEKEDIAKGLEDLIALNGVTKLVMGAAADKHYSRKMNTPKSKTALKILEAADPSCKMWFACKGHLICTREANTTVPAIPPSPAYTIASTLSTSSISSRIRSMNPSESEASSSSGSPIHDLNRSRTEVARYPSQGSGTAPPQLSEHSDQNVNGRPTRTAIDSIDSWDEFGSSQTSWYHSSRNSDTVRLSGSAMQQPMYEPDDDHFAPPHELENSGGDADIYRRLQEALREAQDLKKETYEESTKRRNAERNLFSALQKVKELENLYQKEIMQRKITEDTLEKQIQETEETKRECSMIYNNLHDVEEQKLVMEHHITEMQTVLKEHEEKLAESKHLFQVLQADKDKLQQELDAAVSEAQNLRQKNKQRISMPGEELNTEFSSFELEQATRSFAEELKIGEGGFGSVYKGTLRNTTVAIKLLHPHSMQGQSEFDQEIAVLSRVRHPNLVTLIGSCRESFGLVYEFLPKGSLEDRLACLNNTPPLTWQVRTKIIYEMCSALTFLHSNKPHPIVHGDLKPANILLDANLVSKLGDFGICRLLIQSNTNTAFATTRLYRTTTPKGTFAYMDPEFLTSGEITPRSDVYSLGIIILRLLTGKPPQKIAEVVEDAIESGELHSILDPSAGSWPFVQANQLAHLGLRCAEMSRRRRPDLTGDVWKVVEPLMKAASLTAVRPSFVVRPDDDAPPPSYFVCPIFQEEMNDPHIAADGFTYEAEAIKGWLDSGHDTSPMTNLRLEHRELIPNRALRSAILEWQQQRQQHRQQEDDCT